MHLKRTDEVEFDESKHNRASDGKFSSGPGGGGGSAPKSERSASKPKTVSHASWRASSETSRVSAGKAMAKLAENAKPIVGEKGKLIKPPHFKEVRADLEESLNARGLTSRPYADEGRLVAVDRKLDDTAVSGSHYWNTGAIVLSERTANDMQAFAKRWASDPEWERARHEGLVKDLKSDDPLTRDGAHRVIDEIRGVHVMVHETVHGHGPLHTADIEGAGNVVEEVTTEITSREYIKDTFGYDHSEAYKADPKIGGGYQEHIEATVTAIATTYEIPRDAAEQVLEHAAVAFRQLPAPAMSRRAVENARAALEAQLAGAKYEKNEEEQTDLRGRLERLPKVAKPEDLFARTVDAVFKQGPEGGAHVDPVQTERSDNLTKKLREKWHRWLTD